MKSVVLVENFYNIKFNSSAHVRRKKWPKKITSAQKGTSLFPVKLYNPLFFKWLFRSLTNSSTVFNSSFLQSLSSWWIVHSCNWNVMKLLQSRCRVPTTRVNKIQRSEPPNHDYCWKFLTTPKIPKYADYSSPSESEEHIKYFHTNFASNYKSY